MEPLPSSVLPTGIRARILPGINGLDVLAQIRQVDETLPVAMMSGHSSIADAMQATRLGAFDFIEKPVDDVKLVASINRALARASEELGAMRASADLQHRFGELTPPAAIMIRPNGKWFEIVGRRFNQKQGVAA